MTLASEAGLLSIVYRDEHLVAIHKPAGLLVHRSRIANGDRRFAMKLLRDQLGQWVYPLHRLDRPTSGLLLFGLSSDIARQLGEQFSAGEVKKTYQTVVRGWPAASGRIDYPLKPIWDATTDSLGARDKAPQPALSEFRRLATAEIPQRVDRYPSSRYALLEVSPQHGRRHQIRRHLKHLSHPIIGDTTYGKASHNRLFEQLFGCRRLLLAATAMTLVHPVGGQTLSLKCPPSADFEAVCEGLMAYRCDPPGHG